MDVLADGESMHLEEGPDVGSAADWGVRSLLLDRRERPWGPTIPRRALLGFLVMTGTLVLAGRWQREVLIHGSADASTLLDEVSCSSPGQSCSESKCCIDGGSAGLQCYEKDDGYAECFEVDSCKVGVHDGEKHGTWSAAGVFELDTWSCKKSGKVSKPGCDSFTKQKACPNSRCLWKSGVCRTQCSVFTGVDACWNTGYCMWENDKCEDACWEFDEKKCSSTERCMVLNGPNGTTCSLACHIHASEEDCPQKEQCMWADGACTKDPCSAQWEDCRQTKCCSGARGAIGMTCFEKNKDYATCLDAIDPEYQKGWSGKKLGNRTKFAAGCSWAGQDCSETHLCCNEGFTCAQKDDNFAGCTQTETISTWSKEKVPIPDGWEGTILGGSRKEYEMPAAEGATAGTSLYCILAVLPDSPEVELKDVAKKNNASIFGCEGHSVYNSWQSASEGWDTGEATLVNTAVFLKIMKMVKDDGIYLKHDWTVKVDADCVFLPQRLKDHMNALRPPPDTALYLKNNHLKGTGNRGFLGAIEVFSKRAIQIYLDNDDECGKFLGTDSGEDGFFKGCMDALGIGFQWDKEMFEPNFDPVICTNGAHAAYHPIKYPDHWQRCWDIATGKICQGLTYDCGGPLDPPISSAGIGIR